MSETLCTFSESLVVSIIIVDESLAVFIIMDESLAVFIIMDESLVVLKSATKSEAMDTLSL